MYKKLLSETALYGISTILARLVNYLLVPLHTGAMQTDDYGIVSEFYAIAAFLNVVYTYGMETTYFRFSSKNDDIRFSRKTYNVALTSLVISSTIFSGTFYLFSQPIANTLGYPNSSYFVEWFALLIAIDAMVSIPFAHLRQTHQAQKFVALKLFNVFLNVGLNYFFFWFCPTYERHPFWSQLISFVYNPTIGLGYAFFSNLIANLLFIPLLWKEFIQWRPTLDRPLLKEMLSYGLPLLVGGIAYTINETLDRILIKYWLPDGFYEGKSNLDAVGIYSGCYKLSIFISLAIQGYRFAAEPFFFQQVKNKNSPQTFSLTMHYFIVVCCLMLLAVCANLTWLADLFLRHDAYREGLVVVPFLLMANVMLGIYFNLSVWYKTTDKTHYGASISLMGAAITLLLNYLLIPRLGYVGSAITTLVCYTTMTVLCYMLGKKYQPIPYKVLSASLYLLGSFTLAWAFFFWKIHNYWLEFLVKNLILVSVAFFVVWLERKSFQPMV